MRSTKLRTPSSALSAAMSPSILLSIVMFLLVGSFKGVSSFVAVTPQLERIYSSSPSRSTNMAIAANHAVVHHQRRRSHHSKSRLQQTSSLTPSSKEEEEEPSTSLPATTARNGVIATGIFLSTIFFNVGGLIPTSYQTTTMTTTAQHHTLLFNVGNVANAVVDERNELLCGTGFFTNIYQYKCTEIGDIENEGKSKDLSSSELSSVSSLMDKLELSSSTSSTSGSNDADSTKATSASSGDSMTSTK